MFSEKFWFSLTSPHTSSAAAVIRLVAGIAVGASALVVFASFGVDFVADFFFEEDFLDLDVVDILGGVF